MTDSTNKIKFLYPYHYCERCGFCIVHVEYMKVKREDGLCPNCLDFDLWPRYGFAPYFRLAGIGVCS